MLHCMHDEQNDWLVLCLLSDHSYGFGGKFGIQKDSQDKTAVGWDHKESLSKHDSQKGNLISGCVKPGLLFKV